MLKIAPTSKYYVVVKHIEPEYFVKPHLVIFFSACNQARFLKPIYLADTYLKIYLASM